MRILWVENHARFVSVALPTFLHGHSVSVVPSLAEARQHLASNTFDVILLDYDLDDGKGTELIPTILALSPRPFLVATSAHGEGNAKLSAVGANAICSKRGFASIEAVLTNLILTDPRTFLQHDQSELPP